MNGFAGLRVLALESRRASEMAKLIATYGGEPVVAPAMREVPLESNTDALAFAARLLAGEFDIVIFLTGVGARALLRVVETKHKREDYLRALQRVKVVARGPKPIAVLRELGVTPAVTVPEPNTWRELLQALDAAGSFHSGDTNTGSSNAVSSTTADSHAGNSSAGDSHAGNSKEALRLRGARVAVQEYGVSNPELLSGLRERGAAVTRVPVYQWALPDDLAPLQGAIRAIAKGEIDVILFTTSVQAAHLFEVAAEMKLEEAMRLELRCAMVASIGPTTSEELERRGIRADLEPSHPKMGFLVKEAAEQAAEVLRKKRRGSASA